MSGSFDFRSIAIGAIAAALLFTGVVLAASWSVDSEPKFHALCTGQFGNVAIESLEGQPIYIADGVLRTGKSVFTPMPGTTCTLVDKAEYKEFVASTPKEAEF